MYSACIFDLDGTLANTLESIAYFANTALKKCGYGIIPVEKYKNIVGNGADTQIRRMLRTVCGEGKYTESDAEALRKTYDALYASDPACRVAVYPGILETLSALKKQKIKTAVLSNKPHALVCAIIGEMFPAGSFDICRGQTPDIPLKPSPGGALLTATELGVQPCGCLYIGDTNTDMETGLAAGMDTAGVLWGFRNRCELAESHAKYIIETPEEILGIVFGKRK